MSSAHEQHKEDSVELIEDALVRGSLMEIDWAKRTARLDRFRQKSVKLRFTRALDDEMRKFATEFVNVEGSGLLKAPETEREEWVYVDVENMYIPYQGKGKVFRKDEWAKDTRAIDTTFDVDEFNQMIRESRRV